jgi:hypothetical protein
MKTITRELVKVGTFGSIDGKPVTITPQMLADIKTTFDGKVPVTLGHTLADWMPKFGTVTKLREDLSTPASLVFDQEMNDVLADAVDQKFYEESSVGIRRNTEGKYYLHHNGMLGAVPPKIRDLKNFADLGAVYMGDQEGEDPKAQIVIKTGVEEKAPAQEPVPEEKPTPEEEKVDAQLKAENEALKTQLADVNAQALKNAKAGLTTVMDGRIPKAKQALVLNLADQLGVEEKLELADESGGKESVTGIEILRRVLDSIPKAVNPGRAELGDVPEGGTVDLSKFKGKV